MRVIFVISCFIITIVPTVLAIDIACGNNPADIGFILDSSSSIWPPHYAMMLEFVNEFIDTFQIGPKKVQIAAITYSDLVHKEFFFNEYSEKGPLKKRVSQITHKLGGTETAKGIEYMRKNVFTHANGMRDGVPHIVIVITDGVSREPEDTKAAAKKAKDDGLMVYAIGVGLKVDHNELENIASDPAFIFEVDNFDALNEIKEILAIKVCVKACGEKRPADVVFMVDSYKSGDSHTKKSLDFVGNLSKQFEIGDDKIHVGFVQHCLISGFPLSQYKSRDALENDVKQVQVHDFSDIVEHMTLRSFTVEEGSRPSAKKIAVAILDSSFPDKEKVKSAADKAKEQDIEIFVVGVGSGASYRELTLVASKPYENHIFQVENFDKLSDVTDKVKLNVCKDL